MSDKQPSEIYTREEVSRLLRACGFRSTTRMRNRALIAVMYRSGLRISEVLELFVKDIDFAEGIIRVLRGKGCKARTVGIDAGGLGFVEAWMEQRELLGLNGDMPLFCTLRGKRMSAAYFRQALPRLSRQAGIKKRLHPHGFRHTFAVELLREGVNITKISKLLGHSSIATTARYLDHLYPIEAVDAARNRVWDVKPERVEPERSESNGGDSQEGNTRGERETVSGRRGLEKEEDSESSWSDLGADVAHE